MNGVNAELDLLADPWLPVADQSGVHELSLRDCLARAGQLAEVAESSPAIAFGIYRFLGAVVQHYLPLADDDDWADAWDKGGFDAEFLARVEAGCRDRMRLFDESHPFYQSGDIALGSKPAEPLKTVGYLSLDASTGTNIVHFSHPGDSEHAYCPVCCAKELLTLPPFAITGGRGLKTSINANPPVYVLPSGENLFQTILLNYILPQFQPRLATRPDPGPLWEESGVVEAEDERTRVGFIESLTWPPRRVRLFPNGRGACSRCGRAAAVLVRQVVFAQGRSRSKDLPTWEDPWAAYRENRPKKDAPIEMVALRPREDVATWRDFPTLFLERRNASWHRPAVLQQLDLLVERQSLPPQAKVTYNTYSLRTDMKAKVFEWRQDMFDFSTALLQTGIATAAVELAIKDTDDLAKALGWSLKALHPVSERENPDPKAVQAALASLASESRRRYWQGLELAFRAAILDPRLVGSLAEQAAWNGSWRETAISQAMEQFEAAANSFDASADDLRRQQDARRRFYGRVAKLGRQYEKGGDST